MNCLFLLYFPKGALALTMIFHITEQSAWQSAQQSGVYRAESLKAEGFIHFSDWAQVVDTANQFYLGQRGLVLLGIERDRLEAELKYEDVPEVGAFPHLYGPLNIDAVVKVWPFSPSADGSFTLPEDCSDMA